MHQDKGQADYRLLFLLVLFPWSCLFGCQQQGKVHWEQLIPSAACLIRLRSHSHRVQVVSLDPEEPFEGSAACRSPRQEE